MITHIELAIIASLLLPGAAESAQRHWRPFRNWLDRRENHKRMLFEESVRKAEER